jgi:hypothetical protein
MITPWEIKTELENINYRMLMIAGTTTELLQQLDLLKQKIDMRYAEEIKKETEKMAEDYVDYKL